MAQQSNTPQPSIKPVVVEMLQAPPGDDEWIDRCADCLGAQEDTEAADVAGLREAAASMAEDPVYRGLTPEQAADRYRRASA